MSASYSFHTPSTYKIMQLLILIIVFLSAIVNVLGQSYEDKRCKCVCPSISTILNGTNHFGRTFFIANVPPSKCNCDGVVLPQLPKDIYEKKQGICFRCECKYQVRNTAVIKVVVVMVLWILALLLIYMCFIICLEMLINRPKRNRIYKGYSPLSHEIRTLIDADNHEDD